MIKPTLQCIHTVFLTYPSGSAMATHHTNSAHSYAYCDDRFSSASLQPERIIPHAATVHGRPPGKASEAVRRGQTSHVSGDECQRPDIRFILQPDIRILLPRSWIGDVGGVRCVPDCRALSKTHGLLFIMKTDISQS